MRFYFSQRFLSVLLLLLPFVALTCATQAGSLRARRSIWNDIGNTLNNIGQTIKDTMKTGIDSLFHRNSTTKPETTQPTLETEWNGTTSLESNETEFRSIIYVPIRCPPDHVLVKDKCRLQAR